MWPRYRIFYIHGSNWIFCGLNTPWISDLPNHSKSSWKDSCCLLNSYELVPCKTHALLDYCFESRHLSVGKSYWSAALGHTVHAWVDTQAIWCLNGYMRNIPVTLAHYHWFYDWTSAQWSAWCGFLHLSWVLMDAKRESKSTLASINSWCMIIEKKKYSPAHGWISLKLNRSGGFAIAKFVYPRATRDFRNEMGVTKGFHLGNLNKPHEIQHSNPWYPRELKATKKCPIFPPPCMVKNIYQIRTAYRSPYSYKSISIVWTKLPPTKKSLELQQPVIYSNWWLYQLDLYS